MTISSIGYDHQELFIKAIGTLTIDPVQSLVQYLFPFIGTFFSSYYKLWADPSLEAAMPVEQTESILREIANLTGCAGIQQEVVPYVAMSHSYSNCGGTYSLTKPALFIPEQHLFRRHGLSPFPAEREGENIKEQKWVFSDDEVRFFIARELGQMLENASLVKLAIRVAILVALFTMYASPLGWISGSALYIGTLGLYVFIERAAHGNADLLAVQILERRGVQNPSQVAIEALDKSLKQNLYRRENSLFGRLFILESGDNLLDFMHPFLTTRIENLRSEN